MLPPPWGHSPVESPERLRLLVPPPRYTAVRRSIDWSFIMHTSVVGEDSGGRLVIAADWLPLFNCRLCTRPKGLSLSRGNTLVSEKGVRRMVHRRTSSI